MKMTAASKTSSGLKRLRIIGVIQARMASTRLPGKVLRRIAGKPMIEWIAERLSASKEIDEIVVSTTRQSRDDAIVHFAKRARLRWFRGSEEDLIDRLYSTGCEFKADGLVRITGDCPFVEPDLVDQLVMKFRELNGEVDYITNNFPATFPHGLDAEIYSIVTLKRLREEINDPYYRELIPLYVKGNQDRFRIFNVRASENLSHLRWTVDYPEDLAFARHVFRVLGRSGNVFRMRDVLDLLERRPELSMINARWVENRGGGHGQPATISGR